MIVQRNEILIAIGVDVAKAGAGHGTGVMQRIEIGFVEGRGVPHGIAHPGHFDLNDFGPQFGHVRDRVGGKDVHGAAHPTDTLQGIRLDELVTHIEDFFTVFFEGGLHLLEFFLAFGAVEILDITNFHFLEILILHLDYPLVLEFPQLRGTKAEVALVNLAVVMSQGPAQPFHPAGSPILIGRGALGVEEGPILFVFNGIDPGTILEVGKFRDFVDIENRAGGDFVFHQLLLGLDAVGVPQPLGSNGVGFDQGLEGVPGRHFLQERVFMDQPAEFRQVALDTHTDAIPEPVGLAADHHVTVFTGVPGVLVQVGVPGTGPGFDGLVEPVPGDVKVQDVHHSIRPRCIR